MKIIKEGRQRNYSEIFVFILLCLSIFCLILYIFYPAKFPITGGIVSDGVSEILPENQENSENLTASISFVIELKNAEHLDFNKNLVSNLYEQIKGLDGVWSEEIYDGEHIRIIFEEKLTNKKDITIYPEVLSGNPIMEVYEKDKSDLLAVFTNLTSNKYNRILLTNLQGEQDSFDLKVSGGTLRIEHIYDPTVSNLYDFSTGSGSDKWAFTFANLDAATGPPYTESSLAPAGEITTAVTTTNLQTYNQQFITIAGTVGDYSPLYLKFTITEDPTTITNISIDVQGIYTQTSGTAMQVWAYNFSNPGYYVQIEGDLAITSTASPGLNFSRYINNGYSDFINGSGTMFILFVDGTANIDEYFDYVRLNVTYTQDTTPPYFTSIPANASLFYGNQSLSVDFDATDEGTFGYFAINDTRFSITQAGILTNATPLAVGNYEINVTINDSSNNINWTRYKVQINKSNYYDCGVYFNVSSPQTYPENFSVFTNCSSDYTLYRNGSSINNNTFVRAGAGYYNLTVIRTDTANYTNIFDDEFFTINKNPNDKCQVFYNTTSGIIHPDIYLAWHNCTTAATLKRNDTTISNNSVQNSGWGAYNFSLFRTDSQNYSYIYNESQFIVNKNTADICGVYFNASSGINYPNLFRVYTNCSSSYNLHRNGSLILNATTINSGAGYYNLTVQRTDASNYTNTFMSQFFTVNNGTLTGTLASTKGWTYVYDGTSTIISYSESNNGDTDVVYKVWRDNSDKGSGETVNLAVGGYSYKLNSTGGANYSSIASINAQTLTINQNTTDRCQIFYNTTSPLYYPNTFKVWHNCTTAVTLYKNGTIITNNTEQVLAVSAYNFSFLRTDTANYSYIYNESQFRITEAPDTTPPYFTSIPANSSLFYGNQSLSVDFDATDAVEFSMIFINDTRFIMINSTGVLTNATPLAVGNYEINVTINDSSNNINWTRYKVQINKSLNYDCGVYFNASSGINYPDLFIIYTNCSSTYTLYRNGSSISNGSTINSGAGYYNLTVQRTDATNYTNTVNSQFFTVNKDTANKCQIFYNETSPLIYPATFKVWANCTTGFTLKRNDSGIGNNTEQVLAIGAYNFSFLRTDIQNYSYVYNESEFRITPDMTPPTINITKPENKTYMKETNLQLRFAASNYETLSYQIDNGANITLSGNTTFDTTDGQHTLYIFANNSYGIDSENVIFTVNSTRFFINYSNYKEQGVSTDFNSSSFEDLENLPGVILEIPSYGKIVFNENINLTNDETPLDNFLDIDSNSNISSNFVEINSTALPNFNKSATIYLYGLTFSDPRILRDGVVCDSPICTEVNYSGGTFIFNVSSFTYYSAEETPVSSAVITPSGGGGDAPVIEQLEYECTSNLNCSQDEACLNGQCVKLFDVKIIEFNSPVKLGEFFEFIYFIKGMANISGDVTIDFWIEKNGEKVTSGSDVIYFGEFEEKTEKTKIFLPKSVESGVYQFFVQASFGSYVVKSHRTIEIEVKDGIATLEPREAKRMNLLIPLIAIVLLLSALFVGLRVQRYINEKRRREFDRIVNLFEKNIEKNLLKRSQQKIQEKKSYQLEARKESVQPVKQEPEEWIEKAVKETERRNKTRRTGEQLINEIKIDEVISETERKNKGRKTAEQLIDELNKISVRKEKEEEQIESAIKETERRNKTRKTAEQLIDELKKRDFF